MQKIANIFIILFIFISPTIIYAEIHPYIAAQTVDGNLATDNQFTDELSGGTGTGFTLGIHDTTFAADLFYQPISFKDSRDFSGVGEVETEYTSNMTGIGIRVFLPLFLQVKAGYVMHEIESSTEVNGVPTSIEPFNGSDSGTYGGIGFRIIIIDLDIYVDSAIYTASEAEATIQTLELGFRFHFHE